MEERVRDFQEKKNMADTAKAEMMERKQGQVAKKLRNVFRSLRAEWEERRESNREKAEKGFHKKAIEDQITQ